MCNLKKRSIRAAFFEFRLRTPASDVHVQPKTTGTAIKIAKETTNDQQNKYDLVKFIKTSIEIKVSLRILSSVSIII